MKRVLMHPDGEPNARGDRKPVVGWTERSAQGNSRFLQCIAAERLPEGFWWVTLTVGEDIPSPALWKRRKASWVNVLRKRCERRGVELLMHHVVEFQRRGAPHVHALVRGPHPFEPLSVWAELWPGVSLLGQHCRAVTGPAGVVRYQAKHGSRGVANYQRDPKGLREDWRTESAGRLWGIRGDWGPYLDDEAVVEITEREYFDVRRRFRRWTRARRRGEGSTRRVRFRARRSAGIGDQWDSDWLWRGTVVERIATGAAPRGRQPVLEGGLSPSRWPG